MCSLCVSSQGSLSRLRGRFFLGVPRLPRSTLFPYTTLFRSANRRARSRSFSARSSTPCATSARRCAISSTPTSRSEEHTSELQSLRHLVCRLLLEKKKTIRSQDNPQPRKHSPQQALPSNFAG